MQSVMNTKLHDCIRWFEPPPVRFAIASKFLALGLDECQKFKVKWHEYTTLTACHFCCGLMEGQLVPLYEDQLLSQFSCLSSLVYIFTSCRMTSATCLRKCRCIVLHSTWFRPLSVPCTSESALEPASANQHYTEIQNALQYTQLLERLA